VDWVGIYLISRHGNWRLNSPDHLTERHGLFIILAIGESVVAIGQQPISAPLLLASILGVAAAVCLRPTPMGTSRSLPALCWPALPAAVVLPPFVGLAGLVLILAALIVVETTRYAQV
jgi:hypothetical protein